MEAITFTHEHPLVFNEDEKALGDHEVLCKGCRKPIWGPSISCVQCEIFLHKACAELSLEMEHPIHPQHSLFLCFTSPYGEMGTVCNACYESWDGFVYHCSHCYFDLDIICAFVEERKIVHPSHYHPLLLLQRKIVSKCDACGMEEADCCYICMTCQYCIHKNCAYLPSTINTVAEHACGHPLTLVYSLLGLINFYFNCDFCYKTVTKGKWSYFCSKCKFVAHLKCAISAAESLRDTSIKDIPKIEAEADPDPNLLCLPLITDLDLIKYFITKNQYKTNLWLCRDPGHDHLSLHSEPPKANRGKTVKLTCEACALPITSSFYCCTPHPIEIPHIRSSCNYFLHEVCSRLSPKIQHPCHPQHPLFLSRPNSLYVLNICNGCNRLTNGFVYRCVSCKFHLDVKCASLPATILHEAHKHRLVQGQTSSNFFCRACRHYHSGFRFACETCENYSVAFRCVQWARFTSHRWDEHPLPLICSTRIEHPAEFICEICEYEIHPQFWFYHCIECDNSFHPYCMPQYDEYSNFKFGGILRHEKHPHPLTFRRRSTIRHMVECKCCHKKIEGGPIFECTQGCDLGICQPCILHGRWK